MDLKEARHTAGFLQGLVDLKKSYSLTLSSTENAAIYEATIVLCDRLTELEAQRAMPKMPKPSPIRIIKENGVEG